MSRHQSARNGGSALLGVGGRIGGTAGRSSALDRWFAARILAAIGDPPLRIELWDGTCVGPATTRIAADLDFRVEIRDRRILYRLVVDTDIAFGDAVSTDRIRVHGDLVSLLETVYRSRSAAASQSGWMRALEAWRNRPRRNSLRTSRSNIHHHYDLGNDFYRLWLDDKMVYTCAYFTQEDATLEEAQRAKLDHVCRKLDLRPGQRVVEAGCGWGALAIHMAREYGVHVRAYNISREQIRFARERAAELGLSRQVEFVDDDYRAIKGEYDRFVSVGMLEHVGVDNYPTLGAVAARSLERNGLGLIHSIGRNAPEPINAWIQQRIFPGSYPPTLSEMCSIFEPHDLSILDVENLRLHYARTCRAWLDRFEDVADRVAAMYDTAFVRAWRLYLSGATAGFVVGTLQLFQVVFAPGDSTAVPMTRDYMYRRRPDRAR